jgi:sterol desaturase/sphingolipid hydroxylase (fatty acid hydroxylase superfamily)
VKQALRVYLGHHTIQIMGTLFLGEVVCALATRAFLQHALACVLLLTAMPLLEWVIHKFVLHCPQPHGWPGARAVSWLLEEVHYRHHRDPRDLNYVFAQLWLTLPPYALFLAAVAAFGRSRSLVVALGATLLLFYLVYEWTHFVAHYTYTPRNRLGGYMKKYHTLHHYQNETFWFGITTPLADFLLRTHARPETVPRSATARTLGITEIQ